MFNASDENGQGVKLMQGLEKLVEFEGNTHSRHKRKACDVHDLTTTEQVHIGYVEDESVFGSSMSVKSLVDPEEFLQKKTKKKKQKSDLLPVYISGSIDEDVTSSVTCLEGHRQSEHKCSRRLNLSMDIDSMDEDYDRSLSTIVEERQEMVTEEEEEEVISPNSASYILSSGRQTHQESDKPPTIDDEFEEYFRQMML